MGNPFSKPVTRSTSPVISTDRSNRKEGCLLDDLKADLGQGVAAGDGNSAGSPGGATGRRTQSQARSLCQPRFRVLNDAVSSRHRAGCPAQGVPRRCGAPDCVSQIVFAVVALAALIAATLCLPTASATALRHDALRRKPGTFCSTRRAYDPRQPRRWRIMSVLG